MKGRREHEGASGNVNTSQENHQWDVHIIPGRGFDFFLLPEVLVGVVRNVDVIPFTHTK